MSEEVEQITRDPPKEDQPQGGKRAKNPKKVEAGKKLAEYHKRAKEALAREQMKLEKDRLKGGAEEEIKNESEDKTENGNRAWLPELSFTTVLSIIGIGFTAFDMFMRYRTEPSRQKEERMPACPSVSQVPAPQPQKMGMI